MRTCVSVVAVMSLVVLMGSATGQAQDGFTPVDPSQYPAPEIEKDEIEVPVEPAIDANAEQATKAKAEQPIEDNSQQATDAKAEPPTETKVEQAIETKAAIPREQQQTKPAAAPQPAASVEPAAVEEKKAPSQPQPPARFGKPVAFVTDNVSARARPAAAEADANLRRLDRETLSDALTASQEPQPVYDDGGGSYAGCESCGASCGDDCGCASCCGCDPWIHCHAVWGEAIYMRARDLEVSYADEIDGPINPPTNEGVQVSRVATVDSDYELGYRAGFSFAVGDYSSIGASFLYFDDIATDSLSRTGTNDVRSLVIHPGTGNAASDWLDSTATNHIQMDLIDVEYRQLLLSGPLWGVHGSVGARYGRLDQDFFGRFSGNGVRDVRANVQFDGYGVRLGADFKRLAANCGLFIYGKGNASFLVGENNASFFQGTVFDPVEVQTSWKAGRVVTILELELGLGWSSACGHFHLSGGYMVSSWDNAVAMDQFINAVHQNDFEGLGDVITFDGAVVRAEYRF